MLCVAVLLAFPASAFKVQTSRFLLGKQAREMSVGNSVGRSRAGELFCSPSASIDIRNIKNESVWSDKNPLVLIVKSMKKSMKRFFTAFVLSAQLWGNTFSRNIKQTAAFASVITTMAPTPAMAGVFKKYRRLSPTQRLATTPLFFVSNSGGSPYLQEDVQSGDPGQRIITYFMSSEDANDYLNEMAQGSPQNINEFRLTVTR